MSRNASASSTTSIPSSFSLCLDLHDQDALRRMDIRQGKQIESGPYPVSGGRPDCLYYVRTGFCKFGHRCRFKHPPNGTLDIRTERMNGKHSERIEQPECRHYLRTGTCQFGAMCKFRHPRNRAGIAGGVPLNVLGYPLRLNAINCSYYMRNECCKFGSTCKFNHPQPYSVALPLRSSAVTPIRSSAGQLSFHRASVVSNPRWRSPSYALPQQAISVPNWNTCRDWMGFIRPSINQMQQARNDQNHGTSYQIEGINVGSQYDGKASFPERPGQPECQYYMRMGTCKFGATCKFHHPRQRLVPDCMLSPLGLPLRPGDQVCRFYSQFGICKFGLCCKFDHPMDAFSYAAASSPVDSTAVHPITDPSSGTIEFMDAFLYSAASSSVDSTAVHPVMGSSSGSSSGTIAFSYFSRWGGTRLQVADGELRQRQGGFHLITTATE